MPPSSAIEDNSLHSLTSEITLSRELDLKDGLALGIGGMIGGGIFSVLGIAAGIAGPAVIFSFLFGGLIAVLTGHSYARLAVRHPKAGASFVYAHEAFGIRYLSGIVGWLLLSGYVVMCSLYAYSFGAYGAALALLAFPNLENSHLFGDLSPRLVIRVFLSVLLIFGFLNLNLRGARESASLQKKIVATKVLVLVFFIVVGLLAFLNVGDKNLNNPSEGGFFPNGTLVIVLAAVLTFGAFEGFELISNAAEEMNEPEKNLPRSIYGSIFCVWIIYILVAFVAVASLLYTAFKDEKVAEYALAAAAEPMLGRMGFILIALGAAFSTASAFNASLYGSSRMAYSMGSEEYSMLPKKFAELHSTTRIPSFSLRIVAVSVVLLVLSADLETLASLGSIAFLSDFLVVNLSAVRLRLRNEADHILIICILASLLCFVAIGVYYYYYIFIEEKLGLVMILLLYYLIVAILTGISLRRNAHTEAVVEVFP
ncbi:MAG: APC family permease [Candidatus Heimdallarchaeota archaeon]